MNTRMLLVLTAALISSAEGHAQTYPTKPVRIIVSNATGSSPEIIARILAGNGTPAHLAEALFNHMAKLHIQLVPYKGAAQAMTDLIAGHVQCQFTSPVVAMPQAKGGRVRVLATTGLKPDPLAPELPTVARTVPGYESTQWFGSALPARTPRPVVERLHSEIVRALQTSEVSEVLLKQGATVQPESPAAFARYIREERGRIAALGKSAGIRLD